MSRADLRVVQLVTQREAAGAQAVAISLHEGFLRKGFQSEVWFLYRKAKCFEEVRGTVDFWPSPWAPRSLPLILLRYLYELKRFSPDVLVAHTHYSIALGLPFAKAAGVGAVIGVHHNSTLTYPPFARLVVNTLCKVKLADINLAVAQHVLPSINDKGSQWIPNGITSRQQVALGRDEIRSILGITKDDILLLNVGRLSPEKNQHFLVRLLPGLPNHRLVVLGEGKLRETLQRVAEHLGVADRLSLKGTVAPSQLDLWLRAADVFLFPSIYEAMPIALVEAMRAEVPIIASDIPANREVAAETVTLLSPDLDSWVCAIRLRDHNKVSAAAARSALFSEERMIGKYIDQILSIAQTKRTRERNLCLGDQPVPTLRTLEDDARP